MALSKTLFGGTPTPVDHEYVPTAVFANPNLGTVGFSEERARQRFGAVEVYKTAFRSLRHSMGERKEKIFMKLVVDAASQRVVGAHMLGPDAGEIIQGIAIAVKLGATKAQFDATIGIHPTAAEEFVTMRIRSSSAADHRSPLTSIISATARISVFAGDASTPVSPAQGRRPSGLCYGEAHTLRSSRMPVARKAIVRSEMLVSVANPIVARYCSFARPRCDRYIA